MGKSVYIKTILISTALVLIVSIISGFYWVSINNKQTENEFTEHGQIDAFFFTEPNQNEISQLKKYIFDNWQIDAVYLSPQQMRNRFLENLEPEDRPELEQFVSEGGTEFSAELKIETSDQSTHNQIVEYLENHKAVKEVTEHFISEEIYENFKQSEYFQIFDQMKP